MILQVLTANRLLDGDVVFWSGADWVEAFGDARLFQPGEGDASLTDAKALTTVLIDPYLIDVTLSDGLPAPVSYRERIRALGPTDHLELGKQALGGQVVEAIQHADGAARSTGRLSLIKRK
jgi:sulfite reductase (NADPH) hemoprotein beta-component